MLGNILKIEENVIKVQNLKQVSLIDIIGFYVVFEGKRQLVGEIKFVDEREFHISLIGEILNRDFVPGTANFPTIDSKCRIITKEELELIIGSQDIFHPSNLLLGRSTVFDGYSISAKVNDLFAGHMAIVGNTGSGKSCCVARLIQNIFADNKINPSNGRIIIFDAYGEYIPAIANINNHQSIKSKVLSSIPVDGPNVEMIKIPPYLLDADDFAILLNIDDPSLITTLEKTLTYVYIFNSTDEISIKYKNDIIAKTVLDMLLGGSSPQQTSDQIIAFLSKYNTPDINLNTIIPSPGYNRTVRQCLNIDAQGKMGALDLLLDNFSKYSEVKVDKMGVKPTRFTLDDMYNALEFAIVSEGSLLSSAIYEKQNVLKTRLHNIINSNLRNIFDGNSNFDLRSYIERVFSTANNEKAQLVDVNLHGIENRYAKTIIKMMTKIFYRFTTSMEDRGGYPINIFIEEAHRYIQNDSDESIIGYNIFDRVAKEGRKYGLLLCLITQRLSELSNNALSQCSSFMVFRLFHPDDIKVIASISSNISPKDLEKIKSLRPGTALLFGSAFKIPLITHFELPNPMPKSTSIDITTTWYSGSANV